MGRTFSHWTPRYARDRVRLSFYALLNPGAPWLAPAAVRFLDSWLRPNHAGFEWGAGRSTTWFCSRVAKLTSIEHDPDWYQRVQQSLLAQPNNNVDLRLLASDTPAYAGAIDGVQGESLDFVLVDGVSALRDECAAAAIPKVRSGGILIVDDIHRYIPSASHAPNALPPNAASFSPLWETVYARLDSWDEIVFSSGVTDTAIWTRP